MMSDVDSIDDVDVTYFYFYFYLCVYLYLYHDEKKTTKKNDVYDDHHI